MEEGLYLMAPAPQGNLVRARLLPTDPTESRLLVFSVTDVRTQIPWELEVAQGLSSSPH